MESVDNELKEIQAPKWQANQTNRREIITKRSNKNPVNFTFNDVGYKPTKKFEDTDLIDSY